MLAVSLLQIICTIAATYLGAKIAMGFGRDVRGAIFDRVLSFSARELNRFGAPSLITRNTNDVQQVQMLVLLSCTMFITAPITMIGGVIMALREDIGLSWLVAVAVPVLAISITLVIRKMRPLFRLMQTRIDTVNRVLREQITGIRVVRAFVREPYETARFAQANADLTATATSVGRLVASIFPIVMLILNVFSVAVLWFGARRVDAGADADRLADGLPGLPDPDPDVGDDGDVPADARPARRGLRGAHPGGAGHRVLGRAAGPAGDRLPERSVVAFDEAEFTYPGADSPVVCDITLTARPGQTTAIIGSTGSGKSTLISLIPRLVDATGGTVAVDGVDVRDIDPDLLWSKIGLVPQKPFLFSGTVASNLRYGNPDATDEELWHALRVAQAEDFVRDMPGSSRPRSPRAAPMCPAVSDSACRSPARWSSSRRSTSSTTRSPHSTWPPTPGSAPR